MEEQPNYEKDWQVAFDMDHEAKNDLGVSEGFVVSDTTRQAIAEVANKLGNSANQMGKEGLHWLIHNRLENEFVEQVIALLERQD